MSTSKLLLAVALAAAFGAAQAQPPSQPDPDQRYVKRVDSRFAGFAGSGANLESLAAGLRHGSEITLTGSGETVRFASPTRPMGYGNVTRALDLAMRDLAAAGIKDPTPSEIQAALNGGTISTPTGDVTLRGVLELRAQGMGWGQIAHAIGVHPGLGSGKPLPAPAAGASGITTAAGTAVARPASATGHGAQSARAAVQGGVIVNAAGGGSSASAPGLHLSKGQGNANANANGKAAGRI